MQNWELMTMFNRGVLLLLFTLVFSFLGTAQVVENLIEQIENQPVEIVDTLDRKYDTRAITLRKLDPDLKEKYDGADFNYQRTQTNSQNLFSRFLSWLIEGIQDIFGFTLSPQTIEIITYIFYFLIGLVVVFIIVKLVSNEGTSRLFDKTARKTKNVQIEDSHIEEIDFTDLISNSEQEGNYRNAVRFQYLALLKSLSTQGLIDWDFQKTNSDYYRELKSMDTKEHFKKVSYLYDHVWYGEFPIDENTYRKAVTEFNTLKKQAA